MRAARLIEIFWKSKYGQYIQIVGGENSFTVKYSNAAETSWPTNLMAGQLLLHFGRCWTRRLII